MRNSISFGLRELGGLGLDMRFLGQKREKYFRWQKTKAKCNGKNKGNESVASPFGLSLRPSAER
jgi:hypothetical protein